MVTNKDSYIAVLGFSDKPSRYSYLAYERLLENGFNNLIGISSKNISLPGIKMVRTLEDIGQDIHTLTVYVGVERLAPLIEAILALNPKRIILNPGTENVDLISRAKDAGIEVVEGCTLVMLGTDQF